MTTIAFVVVMLSMIVVAFVSYVLGFSLGRHGRTNKQD